MGTDKILDYISNLDLNYIKGKSILLDNYSELKVELPEETLEINEVFNFESLISIFENFQPYFEGESIFPIFDLVGENLICLGYSEENFAEVYYFDIEFGVFKLNTSWTEFIKNLK